MLRGLVLVCLLGVLGTASASAQMSVAPTTWNVVGLDSNNVNLGPNQFPIGARVCNSSPVPLINVVGTFVWDSANPYINLSEANTVSTRVLAGLACVDFYYPIVVTRTAQAYNTARRYHITVTADNAPSVSTPSPREIYVEHIISQGRNSVQSITGPASVLVGFVYQYTVVANTATQGYEQLEALLNFSNTMFQVQSVRTTYTSPIGATNDRFYADACGWQNNPTLPNYRSCVGPANYAGGRVGGIVTTVYTIKVIGAGTTTVSSLILDFSGSSYHYNNDFGRGMSITAIPYVPNIVLTKSVTPTGNVRPGTDLTYTITFQNTGNAPASNLIISDPIPSNTDYKLGSFVYNAGTTALAAPALEYSDDALNDPPLAWTYLPTGNPDTYDAAVRHVRWKFTGNIASGAQGSVTFTVRVR